MVVPPEKQEDVKASGKDEHAEEPDEPVEVEQVEIEIVSSSQELAKSTPAEPMKIEDKAEAENEEEVKEPNYIEAALELDLQGMDMANEEMALVTSKVSY